MTLEGSPPAAARALQQKGPKESFVLLGVIHQLDVTHVDHQLVSRLQGDNSAQVNGLEPTIAVLTEGLGAHQQLGGLGVAVSDLGDDLSDRAGLVAALHGPSEGDLSVHVVVPRNRNDQSAAGVAQVVLGEGQAPLVLPLQDGQVAPHGAGQVLLLHCRRRERDRRVGEFVQPGVWV